jgi:PKD repeat protein
VGKMKIENRKISKKAVSLLTIFALISILSITSATAIACHSTLGTFEEDFETEKDYFSKCETVYGMAEAFGYDNLLKLRIKDPNGEVVHCSNESQYEVYVSYFLDCSAETGTWSIQLGILEKCEWNWSNESGRIAFFTVSDACFTLTININGDGSVDFDPIDECYSCCDVVDLSAIPGIGSSFSNWTGDLESSNNPESIVMDSDKCVTANFVEDKYVLTIEIIGNGSVDVDPEHSFYYYGDIVNLTAIPDEGWEFSHWGENCSDSENPKSLLMDDDKNVTAYFSFIEIEEEPKPKKSGRKGTPEKQNLPPVADLSAGESYIGSLGEEIEFDGSLSYDYDGYLHEWHWDFGDGNTSMGEITTHNYSHPGTYTVILEVKDDKGKTDSDITTAIVIKPNNPPSVPNVTGPIMGLTNVEYLFSIVSTDKDNDKIKYIIDWADGKIDKSIFMNSGELFNVTHKWSDPGEYTINVSAYDNDTVSTIDVTIELDEQEIPEQNNFIIIIILLLGLMLLLLFLILSKPEKGKK